MGVVVEVCSVITVAKAATIITLTIQRLNIFFLTDFIIFLPKNYISFILTLSK